VNWFKIDRDGDTAHVFWFGEIGTFNAGADVFLKELGDAPKVSLTIRNCPGGSVPDALKIADVFAGRDVEVFVAGVCASAAVLGLNARRVVCTPGARFMIHALQDAVMGPADQLRGRADCLDRLTGRVLDMLSKRLTCDPEQIRGWLTDGRDHWFTADEALAMGLVDEIVPEPSREADAPSLRSDHPESMDDGSEALFYDLVQAMGRIHVRSRAEFARNLNVLLSRQITELPRPACAGPGAEPGAVLG
jgi:ATP-dependent protease ClpP protease subunit